MQMGDHQMLGNQRPCRTFVQKVMPAQPGGPNGQFVPGQSVRQPQQRFFQVVQLAPGTRQIITNGAGPHLVRQVVHHGGQQQQQQFQPNYGHVGTIAGRSAAGNGMRPVQHQQQVYQRTNGGQMVQQQRQAMTANVGGPVRYLQAHPQQNMSHPQQQQQQQQQQPPPQQYHHPQMVQQGGQMLQQHRAMAPQQHQQHQQQQMGQQRPQMVHQQQIYIPRGMNLAVPLREPSPEPVVVKVEEPEVPSSSVKAEEPMPDEEDIDIQIRNVVCNYTLPLHIDLRKLAMNTCNVTYEREKGVMMKQKRSPGCYIKIYSSGKIYIVGCRSEADCKKAARSIARHIQRVMGKLNDRVVIRNYRVNNVLATCRLPFGIKIEDVAAKYPSEATYEPELNTGLIWRSTTPKATLRIHTTGSITVTGAPSEEAVLEVLSKIYPIVLEFRCAERAKASAVAKKRKRKAPVTRGPTVKRERVDDSNYGNSGVINNQVYFSDEDEDLYADLDLDD